MSFARKINCPDCDRYGSSCRTSSTGINFCRHAEPNFPRAGRRCVGVDKHGFGMFVADDGRADRRGQHDHRHREPVPTWVRDAFTRPIPPAATGNPGAEPASKPAEPGAKPAPPPTVADVKEAKRRRRYLSYVLSKKIRPDDPTFNRPLYLEYLHQLGIPEHFAAAMGVCQYNMPGGPGFGVEERDARGMIVGVASRRPRPTDGDKIKKNYVGRGLVYRPDWKFDASRPIPIIEGFSDTATLTGYGFSAIGKPSNTNDGELFAFLAARGVPFDHPLYFLLENDGGPRGPEGNRRWRWPGYEGANASAQRALALGYTNVFLVYLPDDRKDARDWHQAEFIDRWQADHPDLDSSRDLPPIDGPPGVAAWSPRPHWNLADHFLDWMTTHAYRVTFDLAEIPADVGTPMEEIGTVCLGRAAELADITGTMAELVEEFSQPVPADPPPPSFPRAAPSHDPAELDCDDPSKIFMSRENKDKSTDVMALYAPCRAYRCRKCSERKRQHALCTVLHRLMDYARTQSLAGRTGSEAAIYWYRCPPGRWLAVASCMRGRKRADGSKERGDFFRLRLPGDDDYTVASTKRPPRSFPDSAVETITTEEATARLSNLIRRPLHYERRFFYSSKPWSLLSDPPPKPRGWKHEGKLAARLQEVLRVCELRKIDPKRFDTRRSRWWGYWGAIVRVPAGLSASHLRLEFDEGCLMPEVFTYKGVTYGPNGVISREDGGDLGGDGASLTDRPREAQAESEPRTDFKLTI